MEHLDIDNSEQKPPLSTPDSSNTTAPTHGIVREVINLSLIALLIVLPIRIFVAQPFIVSGASMETTFSTGEYLIVDQMSYRFNEPQRGDVVVFRYPKDPSKFFIKRVIGIPGDTITITGTEVSLTNSTYPEGTILDETYVHKMSANTTHSEILGDKEYFVMGDNRDASSDSRVWGMLPRDNIVGRAFLRLYPLNELGIFPGAFDINAHIMSSE